MTQGIRSGHFAHFFTSHAIKGATGAGEDQPPDFPPIPAPLQTLKNSGVLRVHRDNLRPICIRRVHHKLPGTHQRLLIGQGNPLFLPNGGQRGPKSHHAHHGSHDGVRLRQCGSLLQALRPAENFRSSVCQAHS